VAPVEGVVRGLDVGVLPAVQVTPSAVGDDDVLLFPERLDDLFVHLVRTARLIGASENPCRRVERDAAAWSPLDLAGG
jgi:hypothetical protein